MLPLFEPATCENSDSVLKTQQNLHSQKLRTIVVQKYHLRWKFLTRPARTGENPAEHISRHFHSSHLKPIQTTSVIRTRTLSNLFAKRIVIPFCKRELHV